MCMLDLLKSLYTILTIIYAVMDIIYLSDDEDESPMMNDISPTNVSTAVVQPERII